MNIKICDNIQQLINITVRKYQDLRDFLTNILVIEKKDYLYDVLGSEYGAKLFDAVTGLVSLNISPYNLTSEAIIGNRNALQYRDTILECINIFQVRTALNEFVAYNNEISPQIDYDDEPVDFDVEDEFSNIN